MMKSLSPINRLRLLLAEEIIFAEKRKEQEADRPEPVTEEIANFFQHAPLTAFKRIEAELKPFFKTVRVVPYRKQIAFYLLEDEAFFCCWLKLNASKRKLVLKSEYRFPAKGKSGVLKISDFRTSRYLRDREIKFVELGEVDEEIIIETFIQSFFNRVDEREVFSIDVSYESETEDEDFPRNLVEWEAWLKFTGQDKRPEE